MPDILSNFCLITIYLSEWGLSRVQSTTPALDNPQADRYYPDSRMTQSIFKNIERKEVNNLWN